jgi:3',5'-cyclic AMP phosphodiesterase CpdA
VITRILHVSDLHFGARDDPILERALSDLVARVAPALIIASGDLTHRGRREQHEQAAGFLRKLGTPLLTVPGNHDIPYTFPARFTRTWHEFERLWGTTEQVHADGGAYVVGLNSVRPWRQQGGALEARQLGRAAAVLDGAPPAALRVAAVHHHLAAPPWRARHKRPLARRDSVLQSLAAAGFELVVGGHVHQAGIAERHEFEVLDTGGRGLVLATVPGFGRPRPRRKGEAQGANVYEADERSLQVTTYAWDGEDLARVAQRTFARGAPL